MHSHVPVHPSRALYNLHSLMHGACSRCGAVPQEMRLRGILSAGSGLLKVNLSFVQALCVQSLCSANPSKQTVSRIIASAQKVEDGTIRVILLVVLPALLGVIS